jgi:hypothetical protein
LPIYLLIYDKFQQLCNFVVKINVVKFGNLEFGNYLCGIKSSKQNKMKAILIDTQNQTVREVEVEQKNGSPLQSMYQHIGCELVDVVNIDDKNDVFVDEEGLLKLDDNSRFFILDGFFQPLAGNGLIVGLDSKNGKSISTTLTVEEVAEMVIFADINTLRTLNYQYL